MLALWPCTRHLLGIIQRPHASRFSHLLQSARRKKLSRPVFGPLAEPRWPVVFTLGVCPARLFVDSFAIAQPPTSRSNASMPAPQPNHVLAGSLTPRMERLDRCRSEIHFVARDQRHLMYRRRGRSSQQFSPSDSYGLVDDHHPWGDYPHPMWNSRSASSLFSAINGSWSSRRVSAYSAVSALSFSPLRISLFNFRLRLSNSPANGPGAQSLVHCLPHGRSHLEHIRLAPSRAACSL
jgi:hypothetical protein